MKKKYNPFKMWGSWIGAVLVFSYLYFTPNTAGCLYCQSIGRELSFFGAIVGFLLGWLINSLYRRYK